MPKFLNIAIQEGESPEELAERVAAQIAEHFGGDAAAEKVPPADEQQSEEPDESLSSYE